METGIEGDDTRGRLRVACAPHRIRQIVGEIRADDDHCLGTTPERLERLPHLFGARVGRGEGDDLCVRRDLLEKWKLDFERVLERMHSGVRRDVWNTTKRFDIDRDVAERCSHPRSARRHDALDGDAVGGSDEDHPLDLRSVWRKEGERTSRDRPRVDVPRMRNDQRLGAAPVFVDHDLGEKAIDERVQCPRRRWIEGSGDGGRSEYVLHGAQREAWHGARNGKVRARAWEVSAGTGTPVRFRNARVVRVAHAS